jgi:hypothetical protein
MIVVFVFVVAVSRQRRPFQLDNVELHLHLLYVCEKIIAGTQVSK